MGRNIVRRLHPNDPRKHNRLWIKEEIEDILVNESGTEATTSMKLTETDLHPATIMKGLRKMKELRSLYVHNGYRKWKVYGVSQYLPDTLQSLCYPRYPFRSLPKTFKVNKLVNLEMCESKITQLCKGGDRKVLAKLTYLDLRESKLRTFDLGMTPHLKALDLAKCVDFVELYLLDERPKLKFLGIRYSKASNLNLNMPVECSKLKILNLSGTKVSNLNLAMTPHLEELNLTGCNSLQEVHAPVGCFKNLVHLYLSGCLRFKEFLLITNGLPYPDSLVALELDAGRLDKCPLHPKSNLPKFRFKCKYVEPLPLLSGNLGKLISFGLCACTNLESFSESICGLQQLRELKLEGSIPKVPEDLGQIQSLEKLSLWMKEIMHLPDSICMLKHLKYLNLTSCWFLEQLPKDLGRLESLEELHLTDCRSLREIPNSICKMTCLKLLDLCHCIVVEKLPEELGCLKCLEVLDIEGTGISCLLQSIYQLKGLRIVGSRGQLQSYGFTSLTETSKYTYVQL